MPVAKAYYAGGARVVIDGVPIRLARKPSAHDLADLRAWQKERERDYIGRSKDEREDYARRRAKQAREAIELYADMLEISLNEAKARIAAQRQHILANPTLDQSWEYDL